MVLVDTSVWIRFLAGRAPWADRLDALLASDEVIGHELVFGELLIGDRSGRRAGLLHDYAAMTQATPAAHEEAVALVRERRLAGLGLGWIDVHLLASSLIGGHPLWTADDRLAEAARRVGVGQHE